MASLIVDITPSKIYSAYVHAPFDKGKELLEKEGYRIISLQENAQLRMQQEQAHDVSRNGNWVREGAIYVPSKGRFLTKKSPIMANAQEATNCHRRGEEYYLTAQQVEESLEDSVEFSNTSIPTNRFAEYPVTVYAFGDQAAQYGQFLGNAGITEMPIWLAGLWLAGLKDKPFATQLWFRRFGGGWSGLGGGRGLACDVRMRGVRQGGKATAKNLEACT